jgi:hypothetical protein
MANIVSAQMRVDATNLYVAFFGRAPDGLGLGYWTTGLAAGKSVTAIANEMYAVPEARVAYPAFFTPSDIVTQFYTSTLGRAPTAENITFWTAKLNVAGATEGSVIRDMIFSTVNFVAATTGSAAELADAALGTASKSLFTNRAEVALYYALKGGTVAGATNALTGVTANAASVVTAKAAVDLVIANPGSSIVGSTFTLAVGADNLSANSAVPATLTTAGNDLFRAVTANSLETIDSIDAGAGIDTLRANFTVDDATGALATNNTQTTLTVQPVLTNLEKVFVNATLTSGVGDGGAGLDGAVLALNLADATGVQELWNEGSTAPANNGGVIANSVNFIGVKLATTVGVKDTTVTTNVTFAGATGTADAATIVLADAGTGTVAATSALITVGAIEKLTLNSTTGSVAAVTANNVSLTAVQADTLTITGDQNLTLTLADNSPALATINSSAFTKALSLTFTTVAATTTAAVTITAGVGADTINLTEVNAGSKLTVDLGAGADTLFIGATAFHKITLGDGADTVNLATAANPKALVITSATTLAASVIEITDFKSGTDVLNIISGGNGSETVLTGTQLATIAASSSLLTAAQAAAAASGANVDGTTVTFQFGGDSYVLVDEAQTAGANTLEAGDVLIKLTGVTSTVVADVVVS